MNCLHDLANVAAHEKRYDKAIQLDDQSLVIARKLGNPQEVTQLLINLGGIRDTRGKGDDYNQALELYRQALPGAEKINNPQMLAMLLDNMGGGYQRLKNYKEAAGYHERALKIYRQLNTPSLAFSLTNLGGAYENLNRLDEADNIFNEAIQKFEGVGDQIGAATAYGKYQETLSHLYGHVAELKIKRHQPDEALATLERGRGRGMARQVAQNDVAFERLLVPDEQAEWKRVNAAYVEADKRVSQMQQTPDSADEAEQQAKQRRLESAQTELKTAEFTYERWRDAFYARHPEYARLSGQKPPTPESLLALARRNPKTLYLEWDVMDDSTVLLFALSAEGVRSFALPMRTDELESRVGQWLDRIYNSRPNGLGDNMRQTAIRDEEREAAALYRTLFSSLASAGLLKPGRFSRLVLVPDGVLLRLPFAALRNVSGTRLVEKYAISYAVSLGSFQWPRKERFAAATLFCVADSRGDGPQVASRTRGAFGPLKGSRKEGKAIADLLSGPPPLIGSAAREFVVKQQMPGSAILHFATHGALDHVNPLRSALVLATEPKGSVEDGMLEAREILGMKLSAQLAVLSACETAKGQQSGGDGLLGLTWAFRAAGCPAVVASQWEVNDVVTERWMRVFYGALLAGKRKDEAVQAAMKATITDKTHGSPYYWAAFQLTGDSSPILLRKSAQSRINVDTQRR